MFSHTHTHTCSHTYRTTERTVSLNTTSSIRHHMYEVFTPCGKGGGYCQLLTEVLSFCMIKRSTGSLTVWLMNWWTFSNWCAERFSEAYQTVTAMSEREKTAETPTDQNFNEKDKGQNSASDVVIQQPGEVIAPEVADGVVEKIAEEVRSHTHAHTYTHTHTQVPVFEARGIWIGSKTCRFFCVFYFFTGWRFKSWIS